MFSQESNNDSKVEKAGAVSVGKQRHINNECDSGFCDSKCLHFILSSSIYNYVPATEAGERSLKFETWLQIRAQVKYKLFVTKVLKTSLKKQINSNNASCHQDYNEV